MTAIIEQIGRLTEPDSETTRGTIDVLNDHDKTIIKAHAVFQRFAATIFTSERFVRANSDADEDRKHSGSDLVPTALVDGFVAAVADHLQAWVDKAGQLAPEPVLRLSLYSDYTLFRPVIESLASIIWVLGPDDRHARITNAVRLANVERVKGQQYVGDLAAASTPDNEMATSIRALDGDLRRVCAKVGIDASRELDDRRRLVDPSGLTRKASQYVPGPSLRLFRYWATCSAHAHFQLFTVMTKASRTEGTGPHGRWTYAEANSENLADVLLFVIDLINVAVKLLNKRGFTLDAANNPQSR